MIDEIRTIVGERLSELDGVVGLKRTDGGVAPFVFQKGEIVDENIHLSFPQTVIPVHRACHRRAPVQTRAPEASTDTAMLPHPEAVKIADKSGR